MRCVTLPRTLPVVTVLVGAVLAGTSLAGPTRTAANACFYDPGTHRVTVTTDGSGAVSRTTVLTTRSDTDTGFAATFDGSLPETTLLCDGATTTNTDSIVVHAIGTIAFDASNGAFGPGRNVEPTGQSEIELSETGATAVEYWAPVFAAATLSAGTKGISVDGDDDVDISAPGVTSVTLVGSPLDDTISALGGHGSGNALPTAIPLLVSDELHHQGGADSVTGHAGVDQVSVQGSSRANVQTLGGNDSIFGGVTGGPFLLQGGTGDDRLVSDGGVTTLLGGPGNDELELRGQSTAFGDTGNDTFRAVNGAPDVIDGGAGSDAGLFDADDLVSSIETAG